MTKYLWMNARSQLTNPYLVFWSILFIEFWVFMWAFVFSAQLPAIETVLRMSVATAIGSLMVLSLSSATSGVSISLVYASKSIRYVTKYTRLSPFRFLFENLASSMIVLSIISVIMYISIVGVFAWKWGILMLPVNGIGLAASVFAGILLLYLFSLLLNFLILVLRAPKSATFVSFLPMMLGFLSYVSLWLDFGTMAYVLPFNCITALGYHYFSGNTPPTGNYLMPGGGTAMDISLIWVSLLAWLAFLFVSDVLLLRKARGVGVEDIRVG